MNFAPTSLHLGSGVSVAASIWWAIDASSRLAKAVSSHSTPTPAAVNIRISASKRRRRMDFFRFDFTPTLPSPAYRFAAGEGSQTNGLGLS